MSNYTELLGEIQLNQASERMERLSIAAQRAARSTRSTNNGGRPGPARASRERLSPIIGTSRSPGPAMAYSRVEPTYRIIKPRLPQKQSRNITLGMLRALEESVNPYKDPTMTVQVGFQKIYDTLSNVANLLDHYTRDLSEDHLNTLLREKKAQVEKVKTMSKDMEDFTEVLVKSRADWNMSLVAKGFSAAAAPLIEKIVDQVGRLRDRFGHVGTLFQDTMCQTAPLLKSHILTLEHDLARKAQTEAQLGILMDESCNIQN